MAMDHAYAGSTPQMIVLSPLSSLTPILFTGMWTLACRQDTLAFAGKANEIAVKILSCFEEALQLPPGYFAEVALQKRLN